MVVLQPNKIAPSNLPVGAILYDWNANQWAITDREGGVVRLRRLSDDEQVAAQYLDGFVNL